MKLQHRLTLYLILAYSAVFLVAAALIYILFSSWLLKSKLQNLEDKTLLAAMYYLEEDEITVAEHQSLREQLRKSMSRGNIAIFDLDGFRVKGEMPLDTGISVAFLETIKLEEEQHLIGSQYFYSGLLYKDNQGDFIVVTREDSTEFKQQKNRLLQILTVVFMGGVAIMYLLSIWLGKFAYMPIVKIVEQIKERDAQNFGHPLAVQKSYTEIEDLIKTYNHFIEQIAQIFHIQKNFIDYVSHELRTPITALLGTLEVSKLKSRTVEEHEAIVTELKQYVQDLETTLDNMMLLSGAKTNFELTSTRIDEVIWKVIENAYLYHASKIEVVMEVENPDILIRKINVPLLEVALTNIIENATKYSNNQPIKINIMTTQNQLNIEIIDQGIGILEEDLQHITANFYRGKNTDGFQGKGIGLSMANIIFKLHKIEMKISSQATGTKVSLLF